MLMFIENSLSNTLLAHSYRQYGKYNWSLKVQMRFFCYVLSDISFCMECEPGPSVALLLQVRRFCKGGIKMRSPKLIYGLVPGSFEI